MKTIFSVMLMAGLVFAQEKKVAAGGEAETLKQVERDWTDAQKNRDEAKLQSILGDDWIGVGYDGNKTNKQDFIKGVMSGTSKLESFTFAAMEVKILGNVAVVQG